MADLLDRLTGDVGESPALTDGKIAVHQFFAALVALANGQLTRAQIESGFNILTTGQQATDLDFIINTYTGITGTNAASEFRRIKYRETLHAIFMLAEHGAFGSVFSKAEIAAWLTSVADGTV